MGAAARDCLWDQAELHERFKPHQRGGGCCSDPSLNPNWGAIGIVSNPISGEVGAAAVLQPVPQVHRNHHVSNPISGEVGAAARLSGFPSAQTAGFKPHQRGGGCCSSRSTKDSTLGSGWFQTPSAGRWVLQLQTFVRLIVGFVTFQTPSAGRWVLQPSFSTSRTRSTIWSFKPHQRGGGCCSALFTVGGSILLVFQTPSAGRWVLQLPGSYDRHRASGEVSNPISGEVGAAAAISREINAAVDKFQTPSAGRWVLQHSADV